MPTAVLVHGTFHGGWCWKRVRQPLIAAGWTVLTPTLSGVADRGHLATRDIDLTTHIQDVLQLLEFEDLRDVVLLGHSGAGVVVNGVADRAPERIGHLIYLDALIAEDGQSVFDSLGQSEVAAMMRASAADGDGWRMDPGVFGAEGFGVTDSADIAWVNSKLTPHPVKVLEQPARVSGAVQNVARTTYVRCEGFPLEFGPRNAAAFEASGAAAVQYWPCGHDAMITHPELVVDVITS